MFPILKKINTFAAVNIDVRLSDFVGAKNGTDRAKGMYNTNLWL
jgi:hypothetical protein